MSDKLCENCYLFEKRQPPSSQSRAPLNLPKDAKILDIGSGGRPRGNITMDLPPDESNKHHRGESIKPTIYGDANDPLPFEDESIDRVLLLHVLEHLKCPFYTLTEIRRILKVGGTLRIELPNPQKWAHERREHLYSWHPDTFHNIVREAGFEKVLYYQDDRNHSMELVKR